MTLVKLSRLDPGDAFEISGTSLRGTLVSCNECRAVVRLASRPKLVEFVCDGELQSFVAETSGQQSWAPGTEVVRLRPEQGGLSDG